MKVNNENGSDFKSLKTNKIELLYYWANLAIKWFQAG